PTSRTTGTLTPFIGGPNRAHTSPESRKTPLSLRGSMSSNTHHRLRGLRARARDNSQAGIREPPGRTPKIHPSLTPCGFGYDVIDEVIARPEAEGLTGDASAQAH